MLQLAQEKTKLNIDKNESIPTITAKIPEFNSIIGQRLDFSAIDLERLNRMYNCSEYLWGWGLGPQSSTEILQPCRFPVHFPLPFFHLLVKGNGQTT